MLHVCHCQRSNLAVVVSSFYYFTYLGVLWVGRMIRVLRRLSELGHVDKIGPLGVARVDVGAWDSAGLLHKVLEVQNWVGVGELFMGWRTGSWFMMDWNWAGLRRPESRRYSSSVRMVLRERFAAAGSTPILLSWSWSCLWKRCMKLG